MTTQLCTPPTFRFSGTFLKRSHLPASQQQLMQRRVARDSRLRAWRPQKPPITSPPTSKLPRDLTWESKIPLCTSWAFGPVDTAAELARPATRIPVPVTGARILPVAAVATKGSPNLVAGLPRSCLKRTSLFGERSSNTTKVKFAEFRKEQDIPIVKYSKELWATGEDAQANFALVDLIPQKDQYWLGPYGHGARQGTHGFKTIQGVRVFGDWKGWPKDGDDCLT